MSSSPGGSSPALFQARGFPGCTWMLACYRFRVRSGSLNSWKPSREEPRLGPPWRVKRNWSARAAAAPGGHARFGKGRWLPGDQFAGGFARMLRARPGPRRSRRGLQRRELQVGADVPAADDALLAAVAQPQAQPQNAEAEEEQVAPSAPSASHNSMQSHLGTFGVELGERISRSMLTFLRLLEKARARQRGGLVCCGSSASPCAAMDNPRLVSSAARALVAGARGRVARRPPGWRGGPVGRPFGGRGAARLPCLLPSLFPSFLRSFRFSFLPTLLSSASIFHAECYVYPRFFLSRRYLCTSCPRT